MFNKFSWRKCLEGKIDAQNRLLSRLSTKKRIKNIVYFSSFLHHFFFLGKFEIIFVILIVKMCFGYSKDLARLWQIFFSIFLWAFIVDNLWKSSFILTVSRWWWWGFSVIETFPDNCLNISGNCKVFFVKARYCENNRNSWAFCWFAFEWVRLLKEMPLKKFLGKVNQIPKKNHISKPTDSSPLLRNQI